MVTVYQAKQKQIANSQCWVGNEEPASKPARPRTAAVSITCIYLMLTDSYVSTLWTSFIIGANLFLTVVIYIDATREYAPAIDESLASEIGSDLSAEDHENNSDPTFLTKHIAIPLIVYIALIVAWMCSIIFGSLLNENLDDGDDVTETSSGNSSRKASGALALMPRKLQQSPIDQDKRSQLMVSFANEQSPTHTTAVEPGKTTLDGQKASPIPSLPSINISPIQHSPNSNPGTPTGNRVVNVALRRIYPPSSSSMSMEASFPVSFSTGLENLAKNRQISPIGRKKQLITLPNSPTI